MAKITELNTKRTLEKPRILVCDDSKLIRVAASKILSERFDLLLAEDGEIAWKMIQADDTIQMVFTDLGMPNLDGFGLIQRVRQSEVERIRNTPMLVITGASDEDGIKRKLFEIGATDFITKPFSNTTIIARAEAHTSYQRANNELQQSVNIDPLTGTLNRKGLDEQLSKDISFVNRHTEPFALAIIELDNFNNIYERIGNKTSEMVIKQVAKTLIKAVRKEDSVGRDGFAKFLISFPMAKGEGVIKLSQRLCAKIETYKIKIGTVEISLSSSVGISTVSKGTAAAKEGIIQCAEKALSTAKSLGTGEVQLLKFETEDELQDNELVSIDGLLDDIEQGKKDNAHEKMDAVLDRIAPIIALLTQQQREALLALPLPDGGTY